MIRKPITSLPFIYRVGGVLALLVVFFVPSVSAQSLEIQDIRNAVTGTDVTIESRTNVPAQVTVEYGMSDQYTTSLGSNAINQTTHSIKLINLKPETTYHFRVVARVGGETIYTFDRLFKTGKYKDTVIPTISNVRAVYVTATTATIQWTTDKPASSTVRYGKTTSYKSTRSSGSRVTDHDITISGLAPGTRYHYQVSSKDKNGYGATYSDLEFVAALSTIDEKTSLTFSNVRPVTTMDSYLSPDAATIFWRTSKLANGVIRYGTTTRLGKTVKVTGMRSFDHKAAILKLKPNTKYYFQLASKDVFGKTAKSDTMSFVTKTAGTTGVGGSPDRPVVLGYSTLDLTQATSAMRVRGASDVYVIFNDQKYRLPYGADDLALYGLFSKNIRTVTQKELDGIPFVRLVRSPSTNRVYYLYRRPGDTVMKLHIPSPSVFVSYAKNSWQDVVTVPHADIEALPSVRVVRTPRSSQLYDIQTGERRSILTHDAFVRRGFRESDIAEINDYHLSLLRVGTPVQ